MTETMYNYHEDFAETKRQIEAVEQLMTEKIKACFTGKSIAAIKNLIQDDEPSILEWLTEIGVENEIYELCAAIQEVLHERNDSISGTDLYND
jgi:hypothetical protein